MILNLKLKDFVTMLNCEYIEYNEDGHTALVPVRHYQYVVMHPELTLDEINHCLKIANAHKLVKVLNQKIKSLNVSEFKTLVLELE